MASLADKMIRTCIACGKKAPKAELLRLVRKPSGSIAFDGTGRVAGRGAYVCSSTCLENARNKNGFSRALRTKVSRAQVDDLIVDIDRAQRGASAR